MEIPKEGCALCGATWGNYWEDFEGKKLFFCCEVCAKQYRSIVGEVKKRKGWPNVNSISMQGNYRGRICTATSGPQSYRFSISFYDDGEVRNFVELT